MNIVLLFLLLFLMLSIDKNRGLKLFFSLIINFVILVILFSLIAIGMNPIITSLIACLLVSYIILFMVNGDNLKTRTSFLSVILVLLILTILIFIMTKLSRIAGFGYESFEEINMFSYDVRIDFTEIAISLVLISLIGATVDASIAISSALFEVHKNNKHLQKKELFLSGMNIGKDILCTTSNTLLFAFLGDFMTLMIWYYMSKYSFSDMINSKTFAEELIKVLFSGIGCIMIIPMTSLITTSFLVKNRR